MHAQPVVPILHIDSLSVQREETAILRNIQWTIQPRENWVILGPNGSGKSSLLAVLGGYLTPTSGECEVLGQRFGFSDWRELRAHLGIVSSTLAAMVPPDEPAFCTVLTGRDGGIGLWAYIKPAEREEACSWLAKVEAEHLADRPWQVLSMGERQRVLIARALIRSPRLLVLDEPCAGLDPVAREGFLAFISRLISKRSAPSVVLVTHHVEEIVEGFTHALLLKQGGVAASGLLKDTLRSATLARIFDAPLKLTQQKGRYKLEVPTPKRGVL
jgi:iron complex transport system ATP-binding protein